MRFKEAKLTDKDWKSCIDKNGILNMEKWGRLEHKKALEQGLTNIENYDEYDSFKKTFGRPWM